MMMSKGVRTRTKGPKRGKKYPVSRQRSVGGSRKRLRAISSIYDISNFSDDDFEEVREQVYEAKADMNEKLVRQGSGTDRWGQALNFSEDELADEIVSICVKHGYTISKENATSYAIDTLG